MIRGKHPEKPHVPSLDTNSILKCTCLRGICNECNKRSCFDVCNKKKMAALLIAKRVIINIYRASPIHYNKNNTLRFSRCFAAQVREES